ncbi:hypothetical protein SacN8_02645 [Sulfolobus acidocaldarius N8]|uniref:ORF D-335-like domain-containing protein n=2 Tax=Sulfolobus acidocaldarius TaxID=2285 RepID=M1JAK4_9CREN|nr:hypothetical protein SacN8_02645 [Sulfolobus acidocaldarius N8]AGE72780.1 hypothetical protein SacRon12I_02635 [Sulfolobus acidocaldarius Ron12/I]WCM34488.1 hypothetical protein GO597_03625 [Sulfolobus acidocaldarius DSM 639]
MGNKTFSFGDIRIREVYGRYYLYSLEKIEGNKMK